MHAAGTAACRLRRRPTSPSLAKPHEMPAGRRCNRASFLLQLTSCPFSPCHPAAEAAAGAAAAKKRLEDMDVDEFLDGGFEEHSSEGASDEGLEASGGLALLGRAAEPLPLLLLGPRALPLPPASQGVAAEQPQLMTRCPRLGRACRGFRRGRGGVIGR